MSRLVLDGAGNITLAGPDGGNKISPSPIGVLVFGGRAELPLAAETRGENAFVRYPSGTCILKMEKKGGYHRITLTSVPEGTDGFAFGPYETGASRFGEVLGAGWYEDGSAVCIQSLMPKVEEGFGLPVRENRTGLDLSPWRAAAAERGGKVALCCFARDRSRDFTAPNEYVLKYPNGLDAKIEMPVIPEEGPDARVEGSAIALLCAGGPEELLEKIGELEVAEGLPHPTYMGRYAKTDPRGSSYYLILGGEMTQEERLQRAKRAGVNCVYFDDILDGWGHFTVNREKFPGGEAEIRALADRAYEDGIVIGAHSLTNFIKTNDAYVTPTPHPRLLVMDRTRLAADISPEDTQIPIRENTNYEKRTALNALRIGDELITYGAFDEAGMMLTGCVRGAFDTKAARHLAGDTVSRLVDHDYRVLFPDIVLQDEMADSLGRLLKACGVRRMSFDGLEGCAFTGHGNYARAKFVRRVFDVVGNELLSDGSNITHYLWHAFSYCNWGEPWYDSARRGGMPALRESQQDFFHRNLIPAMTGWYMVSACSGRFEATPPENMEFMLSRAVAYDAGSLLVFAGGHGLLNEYLDMVRLWGELRLRGDIPGELRERMKDEFSNWHLEAAEDGWKLTEMTVRSNDLLYCDRVVRTEAGALGREAEETGGKDRVSHAPVVIWDHAWPGVTEGERIRFRIRVGEPGCGYMENLKLYGQILFRFKARGGEYLVYDGGSELKRYDCDFRLLEAIQGEGEPVSEKRCREYIWGQYEFTTDSDPHARYVHTEFRVKKVWRIKRKPGSTDHTVLHSNC